MAQARPQSTAAPLRTPRPFTLNSAHHPEKPRNSARCPTPTEEAVCRQVWRLQGKERVMCVNPLISANACLSRNPDPASVSQALSLPRPQSSPPLRLRSPAVDVAPVSLILRKAYAQSADPIGPRKLAGQTTLGAKFRRPQWSLLSWAGRIGNSRQPQGLRSPAGAPAAPRRKYDPQLEAWPVFVEPIDYTRFRGEKALPSKASA